MRRLKIISSLSCALLLLTACGTSTQKYGASKSEGVYFTVPNSWQEISTKSLNAQEALSKAVGAAEKLALVKWQDAFAADAGYGAKAVFTFTATNKPVAFARVRSLFPDEVNAVSYNALRNVIVPLTDWVNNPTKSTPIFDILDDREVVQKGARGVRTVYSVEVAGQSLTVDQTSLVSQDRQKIYVFIVRCSSVCYEKNKSAITKVANSFTVRGTR